MRKQLAALPRCIATVETAKHRTFQFLNASILLDNGLVAIALGDAFNLGVLSSFVHDKWAFANQRDPERSSTYNKSRYFETFPFPDGDTGLIPDLRQRIAALAEQIDAHRKRQQAGHAALTLTGMYNVLEALRGPSAAGPGKNDSPARPGRSSERTARRTRRRRAASLRTRTRSVNRRPAHPSGRHERPARRRTKNRPYPLAASRVPEPGTRDFTTK